MIFPDPLFLETNRYDAEWLNVLVDVLTGTQYYPTDALRAGWELSLLNQFHDILCGTSIKDVHDDSRADYAEIMANGHAALSSAQERLTTQIALGDQPVAVVFNSLGWQRDDCIVLPWDDLLQDKTVRNPDGSLAPTQEIEYDGACALLLDVGAVPALGYRAYPLVDRTAPQQTGVLVITPHLLENRFWRIRLNEQGQITALYDKRAQNEVLTAPGNVLQAFEDNPLDRGDAWNVEIFSLDKMQSVENLVECMVEETGPIRGVLRLAWHFYDSTITQRLTIYHRNPRIDFRTEIDWQEEQVMLKVAFPVDVRARQATYDEQFGPVMRTTHRNTGWDMGHFETLVHKWADLSEGNYGVALLNDGKYGMDIHNHVMRLTLLRSPLYPDATSDLGWHEFTYSLLPHSGDWRTSNIHQVGYALNMPLRSALVDNPPSDGSLPADAHFAQIDTDHVVIETIKRAEDDLAAWIVRVYETKDYRDNAVTLTFGQMVRRAVACNLVEEDEQPIPHEGQRLQFAIRPRQIKTFKVWF